MIRECRGNLLEADAEAVVNTVNTVGVMGKGIALQFKRAFPANYKAYKRACDEDQLELGQMFVWDAGGLVTDGPRFVINFPTKKHWRSRSRLVDIRAGLDDLVRQVEKLSIRSIAVPPLGCGQGGLPWDDVRPAIVEAFEGLPEVEVLLFPPGGAPPVADQVVRGERPTLTPERASFIGVMHAYLPFAMGVTLVDIQKLMYFMQEAGEPLKLRYTKGTYGPYADNLRHALAEMEGHFVRGFGDGSMNALDDLDFGILDGVVEQAQQVLSNRVSTRERVERVVSLVEGFETMYGLELLATVHWAAVRGLNRVPSDELGFDKEVQRVVTGWNTRKGRVFTPEHITKALHHLRELDWLDDLTGDGRFRAVAEA